MANAKIIDSRNRDESEREKAFEHIQRVEATAAHKATLNNCFRDMIAGYPFVASLAGSDSVYYHVVDDNNFPMCATDNVAIYLNAADNDDRRGFFSKHWTDDNRVFALAHEVAHIMREDPIWMATHEALGEVSVPRTPTCPDGRLPFKRELYEKAQDASINSALIADRVGVPLPGIYTHPAITPAMSRGEAYAIVYEDDQRKNPPQGGAQGGQNPPPGGQTPGQGQNPAQGQKNGVPDPLAGDTKAPGSMGDPRGDASDDSSTPQNPQQALKAAQEGAGERQVAGNRAASAARQAGHGSSFMEQMVKAAAEPGIDWRSYVQAFLARSSGNSSFDWRKPSRPPMLREGMALENYYAPARGGNGVNHVVYVGDTSGSIGHDEHMAQLSAMAELVGELRPKVFTVMWCDSDIQRIDTFRSVSGDEVAAYYASHPIPKGGGTDFRPPFTLMETVALGGGVTTPNVSGESIVDMLDGGKPDALVYFTDLYGDAPREKPDYNVLWLATTNQPHPWGERVQIDPQALLGR